MSTTHLGPGVLTLVYADGTRCSLAVSSVEIEAEVAKPKGRGVEFTIQMAEVSVVGMQAVAAVQEAFGAHHVHLLRQLAEFEVAEALRQKAQTFTELVKALDVGQEGRFDVVLPPGPRARGKAQWKRERFAGGGK